RPCTVLRSAHPSHRHSPSTSSFYSTPPSPPDPPTLSLHAPLPISRPQVIAQYANFDRILVARQHSSRRDLRAGAGGGGHADERQDRKSTRLNSSHSQISYAVFCLKKKRTKIK